MGVAAAFSEGCNDGSAFEVFKLVDWSLDALPRFLRHQGVNGWRVAFYHKDNAGEDEGGFGILLIFYR